MCLGMWIMNLLISKCQWFSGKIQRCHRWAPGSIPGWRRFDTVAEWLRRLTRNQLGLSRAGSSPVSVVFFTNLLLHMKNYILNWHCIFSFSHLCWSLYFSCVYDPSPLWPIGTERTLTFFCHNALFTKLLLLLLLVVPSMQRNAPHNLPCSSSMYTSSSLILCTASQH